MMKKIKIIIPIYNEEETLLFLKNRITAIMDKLFMYKIKVLFVDDGSKDNSVKIIKEIKKKDNRFEYISFSRNFGKEMAIIAGLDYSKNSDAVIIMDADLQDPPELIPEMLQEWEKGYDDVYATRRTRDGETKLKKFTATMYYKVLQKFTKIPIQKDTGDFRLLDKRCVQTICNLRETGRCSKSIFSWIGYNKKAIYFDRDKRIAGETKWNYKKLIDLAIDGITSLSTTPLRWPIYTAFITFTVWFIHLIYVIIKQTIQPYQIIISLIFLFMGIQFSLMGIIRRIYRKNI